MDVGVVDVVRRNFFGVSQDNIFDSVQMLQCCKDGNARLLEERGIAEALQARDFAWGASYAVRRGRKFRLKEESFVEVGTGMSQVGLGGVDGVDNRLLLAKLSLVGGVGKRHGERCVR